MNRVTVVGDVRHHVEGRTRLDLRSEVRLHRNTAGGLSAGRSERLRIDVFRDVIDIQHSDLSLPPRQRRYFRGAENHYANVLLGGLKNCLRLRGGEDARPCFCSSSRRRQVKTKVPERL